MLRRPTKLLLAPCLLLSMCACQRESAPARPAPTPTTQSATPMSSAPSTTLKDVVERDPRYMIGISFPPVANRYPGLAAALKRYADAARGDLMHAVSGMGSEKPTAPYDLSLSFTEVAASPQLIAIAADGSSYTGGAHGAPLIARWVWLPQQGKQLRIGDLVPDAGGLEAISGLVREQLHTALSQRVDADELPPAERVEVLKGANKMIDDGTSPDPEHFSQFEPLVGANGRIRGLRFVFAPYQVGPYSDGTQTVEVPAASLLPHIAPAYRSLFEGG